VIPRIVRGTPFEGGRMLLRAVAHGARAARSAGKTTLGSMVIVGLLLAALGASAGVALRSLAGAQQSTPSAPPVDPPAASVAPAPPVAGAVLAPTAPQDGLPAEVATEENSLATEPVARVSMTARATPPLLGVRGQRGPAASDHRVTHGRFHPTSARPGARRVVPGKPKLR
jgi:hypothetical protein